MTPIAVRSLDNSGESLLVGRDELDAVMGKILCIVHQRAIDIRHYGSNRRADGRVKCSAYRQKDAEDRSFSANHSILDFLLLATCTYAEFFECSIDSNTLATQQENVKKMRVGVALVLSSSDHSLVRPASSQVPVQSVPPKCKVRRGNLCMRGLLYGDNSVFCCTSASIGPGPIIDDHEGQVAVQTSGQALESLLRYV